MIMDVDKRRHAVAEPKRKPARTGTVRAGRRDRRGVDGGARADHNFQSAGAILRKNTRSWVPQPLFAGMAAHPFGRGRVGGVSNGVHCGCRGGTAWVP